MVEILCEICCLRVRFIVCVENLYLILMATVCGF